MKRFEQDGFRFDPTKIMLFGCLLLLLWVVIRGGGDHQVFKTSPVKVINKTIQGKTERIKTIQTRIEIDKAQLKGMSAELERLKIELERVKSVKDTILVLQVQDSVIHAQNGIISEQEHVITDQDSVILDQKYIIQAKDTIIAVQKHELKRAKRQRNMAVLSSIVLGGVLILK